jgi:hypothetical protein
MAPKNKVYCGSCSLSNWIGIAVGIKLLGLNEYFKRLFIKLGIHMTPNVVHYLKVKDRSWHKRLAKIKTNDFKKARLQARFTKQKEDEVVAKRERSKQDGTYKPGQNVLLDKADGGDEEQQRPKKIHRKDIVCKACGLKGHATSKA